MCIRDSDSTLVVLVFVFLVTAYSLAHDVGTAALTHDVSTVDTVVGSVETVVEPVETVTETVLETVVATVETVYFLDGELFLVSSHWNITVSTIFAMVSNTVSSTVFTVSTTVSKSPRMRKAPW